MKQVLHLGLTYSCNMNCKHCYVKREKDKLTLEDFKFIIDILSDNGLFVLYYTFGEPLFSPYFFELTKYAKRKGLIQTLMTNGSLIDESMAKKIRGSGINNVFVSLDSINPIEHDKNRIFIGAFDLAISAIKLLIQENIKTGISTTIRKENLYEIDEIIQLGKKLQVNVISLLTQRDNGLLVNFTQEENASYIATMKKLICENQSMSYHIHDPHLLPIIQRLYQNKEIDFYTYERYKEMNSCHADVTISISPNGEIKSCNLLNKTVTTFSKKNLNKILKEGVSLEHFVGCSKISQ